MATKLGRGRCGAHLSLIFTVEDDSEKLENQGSLGAGICVEDGVEVVARGEDGSGNLNVNFLEREGDSGLYEDVLRELCLALPDLNEFDWELNVKLELPVSQGFGMSASGAIAAAISFQRAIGSPHEECMRRSFLIAHLVERMRSSGLGDTTALAAGGVERRLSAGSPYSGPLLDNGPGESEGWSVGTPILICWNERTGTHTSNYIDDSEWKRKICDSGRKEMSILGKGDWGPERWLDLIECSNSFARDSGLKNDAKRSEILNRVEDVISSLPERGEFSALLCMLGESVTIVPKNIENNGDFFKDLVPMLESTGLTAIISRVGFSS